MPSDVYLGLVLSTADTIQLWTLVEVNVLFCGPLSKIGIDRCACAEVNITICETETEVHNCFII